MKVLVAGAGGFIGGYVVKDLLKQGHEIISADIKPLNEWYQVFNESQNHVADMRLKENADSLSQGVNGCSG